MGAREELEIVEGSSQLVNRTPAPFGLVTSVTSLDQFRTYDVIPFVSAINAVSRFNSFSCSSVSL